MRPPRIPDSPVPIVAWTCVGKVGNTPKIRTLPDALGDARAQSPATWEAVGQPVKVGGQIMSGLSPVAPRARGSRELTPTPRGGRTRERLAVAALSAIALFGGVAAQPPTTAAATTATVNGCEVMPAKPYLTYINGVKYVEANVYVKCWLSRSGIVNGQLREADEGPDQDITTMWSSDFSMTAGQTKKVLFLRGRCRNFDIGSNEELYTKAKINVGGINSAFASTAEVNGAC